MPADALAPAVPASVAGGSSAAATEVTQTPDVSTATEVQDTGFETTQSDVAVDTGTDSVDSPESQDGRLMPKWLREMKDASPEAYKLAKAEFFTNRAYREHFSTPQEAQKARELLEVIGGEEGWQAREERESEQSALDEKYYSRNPQKQREYVKHVMSQDMSAFRTMVPVALEEFYQSDPQAYSRALAPIIANTLANAFNRVGIQGVLAQARQVLKSSPEQAENLLAQLEQWSGQFAELANSRNQIDPEREAFERERDEWEQNKGKESLQQFESAYKADCGKQAADITRRHLASLMGGRKLDADSENILIGNIFREVSAMAVKDQNYIRQRNAILARRDSQAAVRFFLQKFNQLLPEAAKKVNRVFNLNGTKPAAKATAAAATATPAAKGIVVLSKAPSHKEVDYSKTPNSMISRNEAWLRDGRHVRWEYPKGD